jgi:hypothetical protein
MHWFSVRVTSSKLSTACGITGGWVLKVRATTGCVPGRLPTYSFAAGAGLVGGGDIGTAHRNQGLVAGATHDDGQQRCQKDGDGFLHDGLPRRN